MGEVKEGDDVGICTSVVPQNSELSLMFTGPPPFHLEAGALPGAFPVRK